VAGVTFRNTARAWLVRRLAAQATANCGQEWYGDMDIRHGICRGQSLWSLFFWLAVKPSHCVILF